MLSNLNKQNQLPNMMGMNMQNNNFGLTNPLNDQSLPGMQQNMQGMMPGINNQQNMMNNFNKNVGNTNMPNYMNQNNMQQFQNNNMPQMPGVNKIAVQPSQRDYEWLRANEEEFERLPQNDQKIILGNTLYPKIKQIVGDDNVVPKVTGMLVDLECLSTQDIRNMIESYDELKTRVNEALEIIAENNGELSENY